MQQHKDMQGRSGALRFGAVGLIATIYIDALILPAAEIAIEADATESEPLFSDPMPYTVTGAEALCYTWTEVGWIPGSANIALAAGITALSFGRIRLAKVVGVLGVLLALLAPYVFEIDASALRVAYYLWLICMAVLLAAACLAQPKAANSLND